MTLEAPAPPRSPWQLFYGGVHRLRRRWYARRSRRLPRPVLSVGNLHWGGTGKTPATAALAKRLRDSGRRVAILSRGYKSRGDGVRLVSVGEGPLLGPLLAGDEPVLLAGRLPGVAVVVGRDRYRAGVQALERLAEPPDLFLLDDGFSHLALHRDLDLLLFPLADPFGGGRLPPGGRLREPLAAVDRADAALLTGAGAADGEGLARALRPHGFRGSGFACPTRVTGTVAERGGEPPRGCRVLLVSAVARPAAVEAAARGLGFEVADTLSFRDHHAYPEASLSAIRDRFRGCGAGWVLTTEKDWVKLLGRLDLPLACLRLEAEPEAAFWSWLEGRLEALEAPAP